MSNIIYLTFRKLEQEQAENYLIHLTLLGGLNHGFTVEYIETFLVMR